eukprot:gb/GECG01003981.1/.p1 GENE.gb/GECG01003981.1/~~gb/GECG01003981.1/.p1  ORF type:complete len:149 (+),score=5.02 gb/GECG01003981.1/:1-447(+)
MIGGKHHRIRHFDVSVFVSAGNPSPLYGHFRIAILRAPWGRFPREALCANLIHSIQLISAWKLLKRTQKVKGALIKSDSPYSCQCDYNCTALRAIWRVVVTSIVLKIQALCVLRKYLQQQTFNLLYVGVIRSKRAEKGGNDEEHVTLC